MCLESIYSEHCTAEVQSGYRVPGFVHRVRVGVGVGGRFLRCASPFAVPRLKPSGTWAWAGRCTGGVNVLAAGKHSGATIVCIDAIYYLTRNGRGTKDGTNSTPKQRLGKFNRYPEVGSKGHSRSGERLLVVVAADKVCRRTCGLSNIHFFLLHTRTDLHFQAHANAPFLPFCITRGRSIATGSGSNGDDHPSLMPGHNDVAPAAATTVVPSPLTIRANVDRMTASSVDKLTHCSAHLPYLSRISASCNDSSCSC